jgi:hypothetical protein
VAEVASPRETELAAEEAAVRAGGIITYSVAGKGFFAATGDGEFLGPARPDDLVHVHDAGATEQVLSPDGTRSARIDRREDGVYLAVGSPGAEDLTWQLAGPSDPALVSGGKGHARELAGVPLVVAWSPDSKKLAFGSITGEPWNLTILNVEYGTVAMGHYPVSGGYVGELAWAPDGSYLAISTYSLDRRNHSVLILDAKTSRLDRVVDGCHLTWSPDSKFIAIHRDPGPDGGAWVISPDGETMYPITRERDAFPHSWRA